MQEEGEDTSLSLHFFFGLFCTLSLWLLVGRLVITFILLSDFEEILWTSFFQLSSEEIMNEEDEHII